MAKLDCGKTAVVSWGPAPPDTLRYCYVSLEGPTAYGLLHLPTFTLVWLLCHSIGAGINDYPQLTDTEREGQRPRGHLGITELAKKTGFEHWSVLLQILSSL